MPAKEKDKAPLSYEKRFILFLDFLGFKQIIQETTADPKHISAVIDAIDIINEMGGKNGLHKSKMVTQFSDSIVISYRCDERSAAFDLVSEIGFALVRLIERGFLVRGAVAIGDLIHTEKYLLGPAMVEAYDLESKHAISPRVLVSQGLLDVARDAPASHHDGEEEAKYIASYLKKDTDGRYYIDYLSWNAVVGTIGGSDHRFPEYLGRVAKLLEVGLKCENEGVRSKYNWIYEQYLDQVNNIRNLPDDDGWVISNPDLHYDIKKLPLSF
ncbi:MULTISPECIES: hypothetical protein [Xanthomonas]|uniref:Guanylate cyclase domain-containing protein n=2 Tax=Xanthomonas TaxID=338 RepID=A0A7Z7J0C5_XANCH|nr:MULTISPECIES: hypothetical protein [Xanthomonas]ATS38793.1 hypothetical protein XcfCFBP6988P_12220 [Xanthomonas citri pv. phaseoli var. fuscans]ATS42403.1 hypothetical protein XcfCFBP6989P_08265 [Xanthomonas citri pv. phaseoli var. fuscans]ATS46795.1 hypothetical protein XcfCFBP6990P_09095 [Xanthomonas citri pv. phaseoli var. fuscans]ATS82945.1 hypothetical protein XcfCFBP6991P_02370 [Xanthomonas citri pv. phaseoli var. fuscans]MDH4907796.1 hypothetical protein [Xanthomonas euvesicatoria]